MTETTEAARTASYYSPREEAINALTHGLGAALGIAALCVLVTLASLRGDAWQIVSFSIYGATLVLLYTASTFYHLIRHSGAKRFLRRIDHTAIYFLIAGTYTPFMLVSLRGPWGWSIFGVIWGLVLVGILKEIFAHNRMRLLSVGLYLGMGWVAVVVLKPLLSSIGTAELLWLIAGGLAYTFGVVFYVLRRIPYHHAIWHLFVLGGSVCHFCAIFLLLQDARP